MAQFLSLQEGRLAVFFGGAVSFLKEEPPVYFKLRIVRVFSSVALAVVTAMPCVAQVAVATPAASPDYDLILKGGHVLDAKNHIDGMMDVAIKDGLIARVAKDIPVTDGVKAVELNGLYVTPGLIDIHVHVYAGTGVRNSIEGDLSVYPDGFTFRNGITTVVDAGSSGWRSFPDFKDRVIDRSQTRVLAMLNIVGTGITHTIQEQNLDDMKAEPAAEMALKYPGLIVGIKSAHFTGPEWTPYEQAVKAGTIAHIPVMIDYGSRRIERPLYELLERVLRPGDIYTHAYSGNRGEQDSETGGPGKGMREGRARGVYFDVGNGQASFSWAVAVPLVKAGFLPDSISTDLYVESMNAGMKDLLNVGDKFLALGVPLADVVADMTSHPAHEILQDQLGNLSVGSPADVAVLSLQHGDFAFVDMFGTKLKGEQKMVCELTVRAGKVVYDLNGLTADDWDSPPSAANRQSKRWTTLAARGFGNTRRTPQPGSITTPPAQPKRWSPYPETPPTP